MVTFEYARLCVRLGVCVCVCVCSCFGGRAPSFWGGGGFVPSESVCVCGRIAHCQSQFCVVLFSFVLYLTPLGEGPLLVPLVDMLNHSRHRYRRCTQLRKTVVPLPAAGEQQQHHHHHQQQQQQQQQHEQVDARA